jgi:hypothetical protein
VWRRHDDEEIDVAVGVRGAVGERAEQDDLVGMELLGDRTGVTPDHAQGNVRGSIMALRGKGKLVGGGLDHGFILSSGVQPPAAAITIIA